MEPPSREARHDPDHLRQPVGFRNVARSADQRWSAVADGSAWSPVPGHPWPRTDRARSRRPCPPGPSCVHTRPDRRLGAREHGLSTQSARSPLRGPAPAAQATPGRVASSPWPPSRNAGSTMAATPRAVRIAPFAAT